MNHSLKKNQAVLSFIFYFYVLFFISLVFPFRFINSISIAFILLSSFILNKVETGRFYNSNLKNPMVAFTFLFYLFQFAGLLYTHNLHQGWSNIRIKSSLVAIPLALSSSDYLSENTRRKLLRIFYIILLAAILYCLLADIRQFTNNHDTSVFFYHSLVHPISQHAIQFSILIFIALISLFENLKKNIFLFKKNVDVLLISFFTLFIFLLSSKLVIAFCLLYLIYFFLSALRIKSNKSLFIIAFALACISTGSLVIFTRNPVNQRFKEVLNGDLNLINQKKFDPGKYFNGLQFRLLQWRFVTEILDEKNAWLAGVSPGDAQEYLNEKYISENMYIGTPERGDKGFLGYNTHNQFLEALLQTGLIGLLSFLVICFALIKMAWQRKRAELSFITILLLAYCFSESVFETQYSLLIFLFFPLFFYLGKNGKLV